YMGTGVVAPIITSILGKLGINTGSQNPSTSPKPAGFMHPNQSEISGFSFTPLGVATSAAKNSPGADSSHILARLRTLIPASKKASHAGEEPEIKEENMNENL